MNDNVQNLLEKRYFVGGEETWEDLCDRVINFIVDDHKDDFYKMLKDRDFLPNSPILMNSNTDLGYLSACNVLPVEDSMEGIFKAKTQSAIINKVGGGTGFAFSRLRPTGDKVGSTGGVSSGVVSFMKSFDEDINTVKQGGRRRGAMMGVLRVDHPDIMDFITAKGELNDENRETFEFVMNFADVGEKEKERIKQRFLDNQLSNFNISIGITDKFMKALEEGKEFELINPRDGEVWDTINPQKIWNKIINYAHKNGEPGLIFLDEINRTHPINEKIESVNVCGSGNKWK